MIAVGFYLLGVIPLVGIALTDLNLLGTDANRRAKLHAIFVGLFLIVAHIAMIFGMLSPSVLGYMMMSVAPSNMDMDNMK